MMRIHLWAALALAGQFLIPMAGHAQRAVDWLLALRLPNAGTKSIMTPSAWGMAYGSAYLGAGAVRRTPYLPSADGILGWVTEWAIRFSRLDSRSARPYPT
jgi:hypothetical protein